MPLFRRRHLLQLPDPPVRCRDPKWPTFGISLENRSVFRKKPFVWLPKLHYQGSGDCWNRFDDQRSVTNGKDEQPPLSRLSSFIWSIVTSGKDWDDETATRMPGVRDRVVRIYRKKEEGGINLKLTGRPAHGIRQWLRAAGRQGAGGEIRRR